MSGEQLPSDSLTIEQLAEIGRLSIASYLAELSAQEHRERAEAEGWDDDPTGSCWLGESSAAASKASHALVEKMRELGVLKDFEEDEGSDFSAETLEMFEEAEHEDDFGD